MTGSLLEVIALDVRDAVAAEEGGADRLEIVVDMASDGLTPAAETVAAISKECALPQMVMLRGEASFLATPESLEGLRRDAKILSEAGAAGFVFGFLDSAGAVDLAATEALIHAVAPLPWTFHRAVDHAADTQASWRAVRLLPNLATVLTSGAPGGVADGLPAIKTRCEAGDGPLIMAGGGLRPGLVPVLMDYGVRAFHVGSAVRASWSDPVEARLVRQWRELID
ncbi:copper homeostasis protein CutC [Streptosporangium sp. NBC_01639]|uniref:copper homeostasis protein CutC n=1 Tax=unclassified Streptosporangium TaxID=2632669 RepID=UPI002DDBDA69|nr:copper homeostasis protein CutC [Streptosporangium sp. NBC_01756]WSC84369.1 copper homeostasis protein CutC [Streptosporangium sp. NBC_01756]WTD57008.1 copper homeostasis protein CutC [Streptosporangium sp. NBC_01639]